MSKFKLVGKDTEPEDTGRTLEIWMEIAGDMKVDKYEGAFFVEEDEPGILTITTVEKNENGKSIRKTVQYGYGEVKKFIYTEG